MAGVSIMKSLEELCFTHIVMTLEEYTVDDLALLPKAFRERLLHTIPIVDVCRLEGTQFTKDLDMESIWQKLYKEYIGPSKQSSRAKQNWREEFFGTLTIHVLNGKRSYGYFGIRGQRRLSARFFAPTLIVTEEGSVQKCPVDMVNYLVAIKHSQRGSKVKKVERSAGRESMIVHEVTNFKGIKPPGKVYQEVCRARQLVPPRYTKLFPEGSCYLPDSTALELIGGKCHFRPHEIKANVQEYSTLFLRLEHERGNLDALRELFSEVESLTMEGEKRNEFTSRLLGLVAYFKLTDLTITDSAITLRSAHTKLTDYPHTISISIENSEHVDLRDVTLTWLQTCFMQPLIKHIQLTINLASPRFILDVLVTFLSTPTSSSEQTLTITAVRQSAVHERFFYTLQEFDDAVTQNKSLELDHRCYKMAFVLFANQPLRLKRLVINGGGDFSQPQFHPEFLMRQLEIASLDLQQLTESDYITLLQKKSLQKVTFKNCTGVNGDHIRRVTTKSGFDLEVELNSTKTYTLTQVDWV